MKKLNKDPDFSLYNWGTKQIVLDGPYSGEMPITECHIKEDGTKDNKPVIYMVMENFSGVKFIGGISLKMLQPVLEELKKYENH